MSQPARQQWSQQAAHFDTMAHTEPDFSNLLDFNDLDLDLPSFDFNQDDASNDHHVSQLADSLHSQHLPSSGIIQPQNVTGTAGAQSHTANGMPNSDFYGFTFQSAYGQQMQQSQEQQQQQQQHPQPAFSMPQDHTFQPRSVVPPTPNSVEMHNDPRYMHQKVDANARAAFDQRFPLRHDDLATFTPLVSPAVTPHEGHFHLPEYTVPGAYFSPLTSPALEAQNGRANQRGYASHPRTADTSMTTSPIDLDIDMIGEQPTQTETAKPTRAKRSAHTPRTTAANARVRQSPIVKPSSRRKGSNLSSVIPPKEVSELLEQAQKSAGPHSRPTSAGLGVPHSTASSRDRSETESISPEPLSESLMGPPPRPASSTVSPSINPKASQADAGPVPPCPATPASLMRLTSPKQSRPTSSTSNTPSFIPNSGSQPVPDDLALPEAATQTPVSSGTIRPNLARVDTAVHSHPELTPRQLPARKTPKLGPLSTPSGPLSAGAVGSPGAGSVVASPISAGGVGLSKGEAKGARGKKRGSVASQLVSPALRPKISPSIKPLLPEGGPAHHGLTDEQHALLLASKSNYQNLIEGNHLPGVTYPSELSTNLTSKRTSHKLAEQGRRNRINLALAELGGMIPNNGSPAISAKDAGPPKSAEGAGSPDDKGGAEKGNSKASTVENAIAYIKVLKAREEEMEREMSAQRKELEELKMRLRTGDTVPPTNEKAAIGESEEGVK
ncbi:hypothetical protein K490DRAFT_73618 [Saccharata proteae CBS 121410]|uniref:BHLH domain-containing protein n=1 Tax=Saccharata proteae CBS 121410 TaxID=1314787 RepID=A0A9P4HX79_9PEZI|nr:hypothetical protein K490DRAFT_73618 [Saccharata proteae CBS 121410]